MSRFMRRFLLVGRNHANPTLDASCVAGGFFEMQNVILFGDSFVV